MTTVYICRGLPASGKSTWAKSLGPTVVRVNRDDIREMLFGSVWSKANEKITVAVRDAAIAAAIRAGRDVVVDDTNGTTIGYLKTFINAAMVDSWSRTPVRIEIKNFPIKVSEAIERDKWRERSVGEEVIRRMIPQFTDIIIPED